MFEPNAPNSPSAFLEYSAAFSRHLQPAIVTPLVDALRPDVDTGPFYGTVGIFKAPSAIVAPMGQWAPNYMGNVPTSIQPEIGAPDPWTTEGF